MVADVVIPALDEEATIAAVVAGVRETPVRQVVVVDNGSRDRTAARAVEAGAVVVFEPSRGYGAACLAGIAHVERGARPDAVIFVEADGSDDPGEIPALLAALKDNDLVLGSRTQGGAEPGALTAVQRAGNAAVTAAIRVLYGRRFSDLGPFRAVRMETLRRMRMSDRDYGFTVEMQVKALRLGARVVENDGDVDAGEDVRPWDSIDMECGYGNGACYVSFVDTTNERPLKLLSVTVHAPTGSVHYVPK